MGVTPEWKHCLRMLAKLRNCTYGDANSESHHQILTSGFIITQTPELAADIQVFLSRLLAKLISDINYFSIKIILPSLLPPSFLLFPFPSFSPSLPFLFLYASSVPFKNGNADFCLGGVIAWITIDLTTTTKIWKSKSRNGTKVWERREGDPDELGLLHSFARGWHWVDITLQSATLRSNLRKMNF